MRYAPPGLCLNDFALIAAADSYTLLHLQGPWTTEFDHLHMETSYGRALSTDLVSWQPQAPGFGNGRPGRFDADAVWTMHAFDAPGGGGGLAMVYTGVTLSPWPEQSVGLAFSARRDGTGWVRHGSRPVTEPDPRWYRAGEEGMAWRDPFVVPDDDGPGWVMVVCASDRSVPLSRSGCVGWATSPDLLTWEVQPPLISPGTIDELECPVLHKTSEGWLLLGCVGQAHRARSWTSPRLRGPWTERADLTPPGAYAPRVVNDRSGAPVVLHTTPRRVGLRDGGKPCRGMLAQPKALDLSGTDPRLRWWPPLEEYLGPPEDGQAPPPRHGVLTLSIDPCADADSVPGPLDPTGVIAAVVLRTTDGEPSWKLVVTGSTATLLQNEDVQATCPHEGVTREVRVLTIGEYMELYLDGVFVMTASSYSGEPAMTAVDRAGKPLPASVRSLRLPDPDRDDASAVWPGP